MGMFVDFVKAAATHFGIPVEQLTHGCTLDVSTGDIEVVFRVALTPQDVGEIGQMLVDEARVGSQKAQEGAKSGAGEVYLRQTYESLPPAVKSRYGSFNRFTASMRGMTQDEILAAAYLALPAKNLPEVVWLDQGEATEQQKAMAIGMDEKGRYAVDPADLTEEQLAARAKG